MTNHVHLLAIPEQEHSLARALRYAHGRYAHYANATMGRTGHFWQNRFFSCPVEERATAAVLSYIELNPVRARMVVRPSEFPWSSAASHLGVHPGSTGMLDAEWWRARWDQQEWASVLAQSQPDPALIRRATFTGRPLGSEQFVADLEERLNRRLKRRKGGRPRSRQIAAGIIG